jgi:hypothetical protein
LSNLGKIGQEDKASEYFEEEEDCAHSTQLVARTAIGHNHRSTDYALDYIDNHSEES